MTDQRPANDNLAVPHTGSGKNAANENFPVASRLLPPAMRPKVAAFYACVRAADDIADDPALPADEKLARLDAFDAVLAGAAPADVATAAARHLLESGAPVQPARDMLVAFRQDAQGTVCENWQDLLESCRYSANPAGRFLLALFSEAPSCNPASDALCTALQILNHLQDCREDYTTLGRVYVPTEWLAAEGLTADALASMSTDPSLRRVFDRTLAEIDTLLRQAAGLTRLIKANGLRCEAAVIHTLAERLAERLRAQDPLAAKVELASTDWAAAVTTGLWRGMFQR